MAIATSLLHRSLSGAIGDLIFRNYNGKTVVSVRPVYKNETNTEARKKARGRFRDASYHASLAMENPKEKAYYQQKARQLKLPNAYTAAITDYLRKAKVTAIRRSSFSAGKGETIFIRVTKSVFKFNHITAMLLSEHGEVLLEQKLKKFTDQRNFQLNLSDDFPRYHVLKIITNEPGHNTYTINATAFILG